MIHRMITLSLFSLAASCATPQTNDAISESAAARLAEFEKTGTVETCLSSSRVEQITPLDEVHFLVRLGVNKYYLSVARSNCNNVDSAFTRIQYEIRGGQICRNQLITVIDSANSIPQGTCLLGAFEELKKIEEEQK